jgi:hypothetical protein
VIEYEIVFVCDGMSCQKHNLEGLENGGHVTNNVMGVRTRTLIGTRIRGGGFTRRWQCVKSVGGKERKA